MSSVSNSEEKCKSTIIIGSGIVCTLTEIKQKASHALAISEAREVNPVSMSYVPLSDIETGHVFYCEAMSSQHHKMWVDVMRTEINASQRAGTVSEDAMLPRRKPVSSHWIFEWIRPVMLSRPKRDL